MRQILFALCGAALCLSLLAGCGQPGASGTQPLSSASQPVETPSDALTPAPVPSLSAEPVPEDSPEPSPEPTSTAEPYWFGLPVEESDPVEESWFEDAVFLGDSRTEGLQIYSGLHTGDFFWHRGMTVFRVDDPEKKVIEVQDEKMTMMEALAQKSYAKVYIMIGVNELGYPVSSYDKGLREMVDRVKELQPGAVIYLQTLPPVNEQVAADNGLGSYVNNANVNAFNDVVVQTARDKEVALLDVASAFRTEQGDLAADMAADGVHFRKAGYQLWYEYLKTHTLDPESYAAGQPAPEQPASSVLPAPVEPEPTNSVIPAGPVEPEPTGSAGPADPEGPEPSSGPTPADPAEGANETENTAASCPPEGDRDG